MVKITILCTYKNIDRWDTKFVILNIFRRRTMKKRLYMLLAICSLSLLAFTACATEEGNNQNNSATESDTYNGTTGNNDTNETGTGAGAGTNSPGTNINGSTNGTGTGSNGTGTGTNGTGTGNGTTGGSGTTGDSVPGDVGDAIQDGDIDGLNNNNND
jgi:hypothetical protein